MSSVNDTHSDTGMLAKILTMPELICVCTNVPICQHRDNIFFYAINR